MPSSLRPVALAVVLLSFSVLSCSRDLPEAPSLSSALSIDRAAGTLVSTNGLYYPLETGTTWHVAGEFTFTLKNTSGAVLWRSVIHQDDVRTITGAEERLGRTYAILEQHRTYVADANPPVEITWWYRYRQDGSGLYQLSISGAIPPDGLREAGAATAQPDRVALPDGLLATVPLEQQDAYRAAWGRLERRAASAGSSAAPGSGGAYEGEATVLRYPMHPGQTWTNRNPDDVVTETVEAVEQLDVAAGPFTSQRIRLENSDFESPNDRLTIWVSRSGELRRAFHIETVVYSQYGFPIGTLEFDGHEELQDVSLVTP